MFSCCLLRVCRVCEVAKQVWCVIGSCPYELYIILGKEICVEGKLTA